MKAVPQIINNECGDGDCGAGGGGGEWEGTSWWSLGGRETGHQGGARWSVFSFLNVCLWSVGCGGEVGGGGSEWESGSPGKDPSGPHLAAT